MGEDVDSGKLGVKSRTGGHVNRLLKSSRRTEKWKKTRKWDKVHAVIGKEHVCSGSRVQETGRMLPRHRLVTDKRSHKENVKVCSSLSHPPKLTRLLLAALIPQNPRASY